MIVGLTTGEAKCVVRGISEKGWEQDGFLALLMLQARYDANTAASLMQCVIEVVNPPLLKNHQGILKGINEWEVKVVQEEMRVQSEGDEKREEEKREVQPFGCASTSC